MGRQTERRLLSRPVHVPDRAWRDDPGEGRGTPLGQAEARLAATLVYTTRPTGIYLGYPCRVRTCCGSPDGPGDRPGRSETPWRIPLRSGCHPVEGSALNPPTRVGN